MRFWSLSMRSLWGFAWNCTVESPELFQYNGTELLWIRAARFWRNLRYVVQCNIDIIMTFLLKQLIKDKQYQSQDFRFKTTRTAHFIRSHLFSVSSYLWLDSHAELVTVTQIIKYCTFFVFFCINWYDNIKTILILCNPTSTYHQKETKTKIKVSHEAKKHQHILVD